MSRTRHARPRGRRWRGSGPGAGWGVYGIPPTARRPGLRPTPGTAGDRRFWREAARANRRRQGDALAELRARAERLDLVEALREARAEIARRVEAANLRRVIVALHGVAALGW